jgi:hypothetical protein
MPPLTELSLKDTRAALSYAGELAASRQTDDLVAQVRTLPGLVGADSIIIGQVRRAPTGVTILASDDPPGFLTPAALEAFTLWSHQHPLVAEHFLGYAPRAMKLSDLVKGARWRRLEIYNDCYRLVGLGMWEIAAQIRASPREVVCVALQRPDGDFGERERALLDLLTPHLRAAFARVDEQSAWLRRLALFEHGLEERGGGRGGGRRRGDGRRRRADRRDGCGGHGEQSGHAAAGQDLHG